MAPDNLHTKPLIYKFAIPTYPTTDGKRKEKKREDKQEIF